MYIKAQRHRGTNFVRAHCNAPLHSLCAFVPLCLCTLFFIAGCGGPLVDVTVIDQRTALENQVLGTYKELTKDVIMLASVRGIDETGKLKPVSPVPKSKLSVIRAMQRRDFNKDDIEIFKSEHIAGEGNDGLLQFFPNEKTKGDKRYEEFVQTLINEENEDRLAIIKRIIATNEAFSENDLEKVKKIFANLNIDSAKKGEMIQSETGEWVKKK